MQPSPDLNSQFLLRPDVTFLNFGSFGACPRPVFEDYQKWQLELEAEPVQFIAVNGTGYIRASREALADYIHCDPEDLVFVTNPSYAVNIIAKGLSLQPGDEILSTDLEYGALDRTWNYYCKKAGAVFVRQPVTLPLTTRERFVEEFFSGLTDRTKAIFISQLTSSTALIFPVKEICERAKEKGLLTIVDGAHVPGHIPLDLARLQADVYTGACHKWMMTPKGCSFLYIKKEYQPFDPLIVSWGYQSVFPSGSDFQDYHQMQGTRDFSAFLTVPASLEFMRRHNWDEVSRRCKELARASYRRFCTLLGTAPLCPINDEFLGQMCSMQLFTDEPEKLQRLLFEKYRIEIPVMRHADRTYIRYSVQAFNSQDDLDKLYAALSDIMATTPLIQTKQKRKSIP